MTPTITETDPWVERLGNEATQEGALQELRGVLMRGLRTAFRGRGGGESFCEDIVQETLVRVLDRLEQFQGRSRFTTWAMSIAVRTGTSQFRRKRWQDVSLYGPDPESDLQWTDDDVLSAEQASDQQAVLQTLRKLIEKELTDRQRLATEATLQGLPAEEIAAKTGSNRNAVYKLVHDARTRLREGLERAGYTAEDVSGLFN